MGFIPKESRWYLADIILEHIVDGDPRNLVHVNMHLIDGDSPELAYQKAMALGRRSEIEYTNTEGKQVRVVFRGLRELNVIHESLEDGAELTYSETVGIPEEQLRGWITPKEQLAVFSPIESDCASPDVMPESVMKMLEAELKSREEIQGHG